MPSNGKCQVVISNQDYAKNDEYKNYRQYELLPRFQGETTTLEFEDVCIYLATMTLMLVNAIVEYAEVLSIFLTYVLGDHYVEEGRHFLASPAFELPAHTETVWHH